MASLIRWPLWVQKCAEDAHSDPHEQQNMAPSRLVGWWLVGRPWVQLYRVLHFHQSARILSCHLNCSNFI